MTKVLVTGGAGYIGSVLVPELLRVGYQVRVLDSFMYRQTSLLDVCNDDRLEIIRGDARDEELLRDAIRKVNWIIPLACIVGMPACDINRTSAETTNLGAVQSILRLRTRHQRIVYPNTNSGYGTGQATSLCNEKTPLNPISLYGQTKVDAETAILKSGNGITLRLATVFGASPRMRFDLLVNEFVYEAVKMARAKADGKEPKPLSVYEPHFKRNYIHIRDVAKAFIHTMENFDAMNGEPYNVGLSNANLSKWELCKEIKTQIPEFEFVEGPGKDPDQRNYIVSNEKIEATGFHPDYSLGRGIEELVKCFAIIETKRPEFSNV